MSWSFKKSILDLHTEQDLPLITPQLKRFVAVLVVAAVAAIVIMAAAICAPEMVPKIVKKCIKKWNQNWNPKMMSKSDLKVGKADEPGRVGGMGWARGNLPLAGGVCQEFDT